MLYAIAGLIVGMSTGFIIGALWKDKGKGEEFICIKHQEEWNQLRMIARCKINEVQESEKRAEVLN